MVPKRIGNSKGLVGVLVMMQAMVLPKVLEPPWGLNYVRCPVQERIQQITQKKTGKKCPGVQPDSQD